MILICGLPNSGKTSYSKQYKNVVHLDDYMVEGKKAKEYFSICNKVAKNLGDNVVIEGVYNTARLRKKLLSLFPDSKNTCIYLDTDYDECIKRESRGRDLEIINMWNKIFEKPSVDEGWDKIIIVK